ncbi:ADP-heptose--LPS heptosyltransferase 2 [Geobacter sp. OR-1]|uniref:lipopolysaccharide heptosyltransferase II n=1 Tax=Geobacter sp. OR-1 TaxID=1266765 RepID=UPI000541E7E1|nr:lipopolysaccharide heptosyltransferase II [Geobacter sp. OR-1]GAM07930.1 ADP-heptose--LPS heptosyltransferase 2 [Geobacter sp. OR-1]
MTDKRSYSNLDRSSIRKILIRATNWIGDAVMTLPAIGTVRAAFPEARITILANQMVAGLFSPHPWVDEVLVYDRKGRHKGLAGRFRLAAELRRHGFDLALLLPDSFDGAFITLLAGIPRRLGNRSDGRGLLLTHPFPLSLQPKGEHQSENYLAMLAHFGITSAEQRQLLVTTAAEDNAVADRLGRHGIGRTDFVLGINPGATYGSAKRWYPDRFAAVAAELASAWGAKVVITGGPGEAAIAADIESGLAGACANMAGKTTVRELLALVKRCDFFITNDSGPMHLAAAFGVPLVAIFGSTDHTTTYPLTEYGVVVRETVDCAPCMKRECPTDHRCMKAVTVAAVVEAARDLRGKIIPPPENA